MREFKKKRIFSAIIDLAFVIIIDILFAVLFKIVFKKFSVLLFPIFFIIYVIYFTLIPLLPMNGTPGLYFQKLFIRQKNGENVGFKALFIRTISSFFSNLLLGFGFFYFLFDSNGRTIYDYISDTVVDSIESKTRQKEKAFLVSVGKSLPEKQFEINEKGLLIGRNPNTCDIVLPADEPCVSRIHCQVSFNAQTKMLLIKDMGSSFGTFLSSGERIENDRVAALASGKSFYLGSRNTKFRFFLES